MTKEQNQNQDKIKLQVVLYPSTSK